MQLLLTSFQPRPSSKFLLLEYSLFLRRLLFQGCFRVALVGGQRVSCHIRAGLLDKILRQYGPRHVHFEFAQRAPLNDFKLVDPL